MLDIARNRRFTRGLDAHLVRARKRDDNTVQLRVRGLRPGKRYFYRFSRGRRRSDVGTFVTAPRASRDAAIEFGWTGDTDFNAAPGQRRPYWNSGGIYRRMRAERNHFNVNLGDTMYSDSEIPGRLNPIALTVRQKWAKYRINLRNRHLRGVRGAAGFYSHWDDHEFVNDFSPAENSFDNDVNIPGSTLYRRGAQAFRDYSPVTFTEPQRPVPAGPLGPQPRAVLPRRALVPQRERRRERRLQQPADRPPGLRSDRAADDADGVRAGLPAVRLAGVAGLHRRDQRPEPDVPRPAAARRASCAT